MTGDTQRFLPESLRPPVAGRKSRRGFALLTVVPVILSGVSPVAGAARAG